MKVSRKLDWYAIASALGAVLLFLPMFRAGMPNTADGLLHLYRSALWRWAWNDGVIWPRWHTLLYHGYGYPVFDLIVPFPYIATSLLNFLIPSLIASFKAFIFIGCLNYALGMYFWARRHLSPAGAFLAAIAYTFATYRFRELFVQGNYPQFFAWSMFPWVMLSFESLSDAPTRWRFFASVASYSILLLTHNISAMLFTPFLIAYMLWYLASHGVWRNAWAVAAAFVGAVGIAAGFWIPAMVESRYTMVRVLTKGFFDVSEHFLTVGEMLSRSPLQDYRAANPPMPFNIGVIHLFLAVTGLFSILTVALRSRGDFLSKLWKDYRVFSAIAVVVSLFMMLPVSSEVWKVVPFIAFAEFPTRLYGEAFLFSSLLVGASITWLGILFKDEKKEVLATALFAAIGALALVGSVAVYQFPRQFIRLEVTPSAFLSYETAFNAPGTTSASEFLSIPAEKAPKEPAISKTMVRNAFYHPPSGVYGKVIRWKAQSIEIEYTSDRDIRVDVAQFYFPGWVVSLDGRMIEASRDPRNGLVRVRLPSGRHMLALRMANTPIRKAAGAEALLAFLAVVILGLKLGKGKAGEDIRSSPNLEFGYLPVLVLVALIVIKVAYIEPRTQWFRLFSPPGQALPASHKCHIRIGKNIELIGYDIHPEVTRQGGKFFVRLYWQPLGKVEKDYSSFVHLVAGLGKQAFAFSDSLHPAYIPTSTWHPALYVVDDHVLPVRKDSPPVVYHLLVGMYEVNTRKPLGDSELPTVVHVLPRNELKPSDVPVKLEASFGDRIELVGYGMKKDGRKLTLTLYWLPLKHVDKDYQVFVHLKGADGKIVGQYDSPPVRGFYPTSMWLPGHIVEDVHDILLPSGEVEPHEVDVGLYDLRSLARLPARDRKGKSLPNSQVSIPIGGAR